VIFAGVDFNPETLGLRVKIASRIAKAIDVALIIQSANE
jgi:hypothetical protein